MGPQRFTVFILGACSCLDWGGVRRKVTMDGSIWKRKKLGLGEAWRCTRAWLTSAFSGRLLCPSCFFSISLLVGFLLSRLKALIMALNRFKSFCFSIQRSGVCGYQSQPPFCLILSDDLDCNVERNSAARIPFHIVLFPKRAGGWHIPIDFQWKYWECDHVWTWPLSKFILLNNYFQTRGWCLKIIENLHSSYNTMFKFKFKWVVLNI